MARTVIVRIAWDGMPFFLNGARELARLHRRYLFATGADARRQAADEAAALLEKLIADCCGGGLH